MEERNLLAEWQTQQERQDGSYDAVSSNLWAVIVELAVNEYQEGHHVAIGSADYSARQSAGAGSN